MSFFKIVFWNKDQRRLRTLWRLALHTLLLFVLTGFITVLLLFVLVIVDVIAGANLSEVVSGQEPMAVMNNPWVSAVIIPGATLTGVFLATYLCGRWVDRRKFSSFGFRFSKAWWRNFSFGFILGAFLMGLIFMFGWITGNVRVIGFFQAFSENGHFLTGFLQAVIFFLCVGFYEEVLSRGYHLVNLAEGFNGISIGKRGAVILSIALSSLVFGLLHINNPNASWVSTINISLSGMFLGLGMILTGSLAIPIGLHIAWNLFQGNVFGFPVSGTMTGATIIATELVGPEWLTGGSFGPEAGVMGLMAMAAGSVLTLLWVRRKGSISLREDLAEYKPLVKDGAEAYISLFKS